MTDMLKNCQLCPRACGADRTKSRGACGAGIEIEAARASLHMWEEPPISGTNGSGTVFFSHCSLGCVFCQNRKISRREAEGQNITADALAKTFLSLEKKGAHNINLVTGAHYVPQIIEALQIARKQGLSLPVVYNSSGYEKVETLKLLEGYVDVYLPDMKYMDAKLAADFSHAPDYPEVVENAIREMVRQTGACVFGEDGYIRKGTIVRHLILPGHTKNSIAVLQYLHETYGDKIMISMMNQFTPVWKQEKFLELNRKVTKREYEKVLNAALELGIENGYFQEGKTAKESFIPAFDEEGI